MPSQPLPPVLEQAQYELAFEQRVESELSRLTRAFLNDEEINGAESGCSVEGGRTVSARELVAKRAQRRFEITAIERGGAIRVPLDRAWEFIEALLEPFARKRARAGLKQPPEEPTSREPYIEEHDDVLQDGDDGPELADRLGYSRHGTSIFSSVTGLEPYEPDEEEARRHAHARAHAAIDEALELVRQYAPSGKRWETRLDATSKKLRELMRDAFLPPDEVTASWALEVVTEAFGKLSAQVGLHVLYAYAGKVMALAGFAASSEGTSHTARFRQALLREKKKTGGVADVDAS